MSYYLHPLRVLVGKLETTAGTAETLTDADFDVRIRNPEVTPQIEMDDEASKYARGDHGEDTSISGAQSAQVTFSIRMVRGSTVATTPNWWKFCNACGLYTTSWASAGKSLDPLKAYDNKTMTIWIYDIQRGATPAAVCYKLAGCMGNVVFTSEGVGMPWMANFTMTGKLQDIDMAVANADIPVPLDLDATCAEKFLSNQCYVGSTAEKISTFSMDVGNEIQPVFDQSDATGIAYHAITSRRPRLAFNPLMVSSRDVWNDIANGVTGCASTYSIMIGDTGLGRYSLHIPKGQFISAGLANREGMINWDATIKCLANGITGSVSDGDLEEEATWQLLQGARS